MQVNPKRTGAKRILKLAPGKTVFERQRIFPVEPARPAVPETLRRKDDAKPLPCIPALADKRVRHIEYLPAGPQRSLRDCIRVIHRNIVFVISHESEEAFINTEHCRMSIRRSYSYFVQGRKKFQFGIHDTLAVLVKIVRMVGEVAGYSAFIRYRKQRDQRRRLLRISGIIAADIESAPGKRTEIAVTGAIHKILCEPRLTAFLGLRDNSLDPPSGSILHNPGYRCVKTHPYSGLDAHFLAHKLHVFRLIYQAETVGFGAAVLNGAILFEPSLDLLVKIALVDADKTGKHSARPYAAETSLRLEKNNLRSLSRRRHSSGNSGRPASGNKHVTAPCDGNITRRLLH